MSAILRSGAVLGPYRIVAPLGAGGMGEVFRAHDTKLDRPVALKVLPAEVTRDADRLRRFVQEAKSASSLSHPNIVVVHDIGSAVPVEEGGEPSADGAAVHYIAMELVEGHTLRQLFADRSVEPRTLLAHLAQAAEGLAKAHAAGIVHRDLKPENIMVTRDGYAKVLDFGLAKLTEPSVSGSALAAAPTALAEEHTRDGAVMGTIGYMSPEQAQGKPVDHRTDLFAFGCLLYEAATGKRPFTGESNVDILHAIVREKPTPVEEIAPTIPRALVRTIRRCLAKDPDRRFQGMKDLALELHEMVDDWDDLALPSGTVSSASTLSGTREPSQGGLGRAGRIAVVVAAIAVTALAVVAVMLWRGRSASTQASSAFQSMRITAATSTGDTYAASISADGRYLVYTRRQESLWLRHLATGSDVRLLPPQSTGYVVFPAVSPDGNYVYYAQSNEQLSARTLFRMPVLGGTPREVISGVDSPVGFSPDGSRIAVVRNDRREQAQRLVVVNADGSGDETTLTTRARKDQHGFYGWSDLAWSPDGSRLVVWGWDTGDGKLRRELVQVELDGGRQTRIGTTVWGTFSGVAWLPDGSALIVSAGRPGVTLQDQLWRVPVPDGEPVRITNDSQYYLGVSLSRDGRLLASIQESDHSTLWRRPLSGAGEERQLTFSSRENAYGLVALADGSVVFTLVNDDSGWSVARLAGDGGEPFVLTRPGDQNYFAQVSRDGGTYLMQSKLADGRLVLRATDRDGSHVREVVRMDEYTNFALHPDGSWFVFTDSQGLWRRSLDGGEPTLVVGEPGASPIGFSPDGNRLAYTSAGIDPGGSEENPTYFVIPAAGGAPLARVPKPKGPFWGPRWAPDGKALTLRKREGDGFNLWRLPLDGSPLERLTDLKDVNLWNYAISPDGKTLFYTKGVDTSDAVLIENFR